MLITGGKKSLPSLDEGYRSNNHFARWSATSPFIDNNANTGGPQKGARHTIIR